MSEAALSTGRARAKHSMQPSRVTMEVVTSLSGLAALRGEWDELFRRAAGPQQVFQSFEFVETWARHYLDGSARLHVILGRLDGRLEAVVPLMRQRFFGLEILRLMGAPVAQFDDAIIASDISDEFHVALRQAIETSGADLLEVRRVRDDSALRRLLPAHSLSTETLEAPFADLETRVADDGPGLAYSAKERSAHRRRMRRLSEIGHVVCRDVEPGPEAARLAAAAVDMKRAWLAANGLASPTVNDARFGAFFVDMAGKAGSPLHVSAIELDGKPIAIDLSFDCKGSTFGHVIATDARFEREGVGQLLIHHVFATAKARGSTIFDLMTPADDYKRRHSDGSTRAESLIVPFSARGRLVGGTLFRHAFPTAKSFARRLPSGLRRLLVR